MYIEPIVTWAVYSLDKRDSHSTQEGTFVTHTRYPAKSIILEKLGHEGIIYKWVDVTKSDLTYDPYYKNLKLNVEQDRRIFHICLLSVK